MDAEDLLYILYTSRHHRQAQGHRAHHRRLPARRRRHRPKWSSTSRTTTSTGAPPTSAGSPGTATSSTGRSRTARPCVMYEGAPDWPDKDRFWDDHRALRRHDLLHRAHRDPRVHALGHRVPASARPLVAAPARHRSASRSTPRRGSGTGRCIGGERCPIVDTWWQTETGAIMITPLPGITADQARARPRVPFPGIEAEVVDERRRAPCRSAAAATSCSRSPWPAMLRTHLGRSRALRRARTSAQFGADVYFTGDGARARRGRLLLAARAASTT